MRAPPPLLAAALVALGLAVATGAPAQTLAPGALTPEQKAAIDARIREFLLENPEVLLEAFEVLEARRLEAEAAADGDLIAANAAALFEDGHAFPLGAPDGDAVIVMFSDYRCGYCKAAHGALTALLGEDPGVRVLVREFPILGPESLVAARAAMAAARLDPALYAPFHDALMAFRGQLDETAVFALAADLGIDEARLRGAMGAAGVDEALRATYSLARTLEISGTPTFVIGDRIVRGFVQPERLRELIAESREQRG